ncbi:pilus assembly protein TadE [[Pantoea] beijingensis]|uniref:Pilus assembly protein TadE n=1 Tax=[Pantoea] beijingensis TaxID=1324864 RepID=A0A443IGW4_9GAMM|nr:MULTISPECIES: TadE/TadG family type IV pilus assembly protein [Erwiniaceae]RWR03299.1 pilus assembly protein TadE [[Pantoea] beijingensis]
MRLSKNFTQDQRGVATVEFALLAVVFFMILFFTAEISRVAYVSSVIDLALSESAKSAKNEHAISKDGTTDSSRFQQRLLQDGGRLWGFLRNNDMVNIEITYADSVAEMIASGGHQGNGTNQALARYHLIYQYKAMFFPFPKSWVNSLLNREVIFVQEYERSKFMD